MPAQSGSIAAPLHVIDAAGEIDPLAALVIGQHDAVFARRIDRRGLQLRASLDLRRRRIQRVVAWGQPAYRVARAAEMTGIYRLRAGDPLPAPAAGWRVAANTSSELNGLLEAGWPDQCVVVRPPGVDLLPRRGVTADLRRRSLGIAEDDYVWLLAGDPSAGAGLREAIWAGTVLHVLQRGNRRHRLLLWGDSIVQQRARRFANQLGLPELCFATTRYPYHAVARLADAAILLPKGAGATWSAAVVALAGMPAVINGAREIQEMLGRRTNVRTAWDAQPRSTVREMLWLSEAATARIEPDPAYDPGGILGQWQALAARP
jgi:hypothetical protein